MQALTGALIGSLAESGHPKVLVERASLALLDYIERNEDGFRILVRDSPVAQATGTFSSLIGDVATQVQHLLERSSGPTGWPRARRRCTRRCSWA